LAIKFSGENSSAELFEKAIEAQKLNKRIADNVKESDKQIPGMDNPKEIVKWMYSAKKGDVSQVFELKDRFIVALLVGIREKGTLPLDEVRDEVIAKVRREKKAADFVKEFTAKAGSASTIMDVAGKMGLNAETQDKLMFRSYNVNNLGREDALIGSAAGLKKGVISKPIVGENGVFQLVLNATEMAPAPPDYKNQKMVTELTVSGRADYEVFNALKDLANIEDHKSRFE
jgi:peptidyl-prolyl cis-trans isomerase D